MKSNKWWLVVALTLLLFTADHSAISQDTDHLQGPILLGQPVGDRVITLHDVGTGRVWEVKPPDSSFGPYIWSPSGCQMLLGGNTHWYIISIKDSSIRQIPHPTITKPNTLIDTWSLDGRSVTFTVVLGANIEWRIYSLNLETYTTELVLSQREWVRAVRWLSNRELLYETRTALMLWDTQGKQSRIYSKFSVWSAVSSSMVYYEDDSPNRHTHTGYYSMAFYDEYRAGERDNLTPEEKAEIEATPQISGFDLYLEDGAKRHINVNGQFVQTLSWSPSNQQIAVTTYPPTSSTVFNGIYIYDITKDELRRVGSFPALRNGEYGAYVPTWSSDGEWLAFNTPTGYVIYRLTDGKTVKLAKQFSGAYIGLNWSPIMNYKAATC